MNTKKLIIICGGVLGFFLLIFLIIWLVSLSKPKYITYEQLETKIVDASKKYVLDNESKFTTEGVKYNLQYQSLVNGEYIKPMEELLSDSTGCNAYVTISKQDETYAYVPYLNCGENYKTIELYKQILNDNEVVTANSGLYKLMDGTYYFRGKNLNNYVSFGTTKNVNKTEETIWQIISINSDNTIRLRAISAPSTLKTQYDDRYNIDKKESVGYNRFNDSLLSETLESLYEGSDIFDEEQKSKLTSRKLCIGTREVTDEVNDGSIECAVMSEKEYYIWTLFPYEYIRASLDENCKTLSDRSCANYNFIAENQQSTSWTTTTTVTDSYHAYAFDGSIYDLKKASSSARLYLVIDLNDYAFYKSGDGSLENPYTIKLNNSAKTQTESN